MMRFGKFNLVGLLGAAWQLLAFDVLLRCGVPAGGAAPLAVELAILPNFFWHERFTWPDRGQTGFGRRAARLWRFHAGNGLVSLAGNAALSWYLVEQLHAPALPSAVAAIVLCAPVNFLLADRWVYSE